MAAAAASASKSLLLLGGTGFIGGGVLDKLMHSPLSAGWSVTTVSRGADKAAILRERYGKGEGGRSFKVVETSHSDVDQIKALAAQSDIVINLADADDLPLANALTAGLEERAKSQGAGQRKPLLMHNSGTSVLTIPGEDDGNTANHHVWDDADPESDFWKLPSSAPHHIIDAAVVAAQERGIDTVLVVPPTIYGKGAGINQRSSQIPTLTKAALLRAKPQAGVLGAGKNEWSYVHVHDLARAYLLLLQSALGVNAEGQPDASVKPLQYGRASVVYASTGTYVHSELAKRIGEILHKLAPELVCTAAVKPFEPDEYELIYGKFRGAVFGGNAVCRSSKLTAMGWGREDVDFWDALEEEISVYVDQKKAGKLEKGAGPTMDK